LLQQPQKAQSHEQEPKKKSTGNRSYRSAIESGQANSEQNCAMP